MDRLQTCERLPKMVHFKNLFLFKAPLFVMIDKVTMTVTTKIFSKYSKFWWTNIDSETPRAIKKIKK